MPTIYPSRSCFDDAIDFIETRVRENPQIVHGTSLLLVHGIAIAPPDHDGSIVTGQPFAHAWVDEHDRADGDVAWASGILDGSRVYYAVRRREFYRYLRIRRFTRYTLREVWEHNQQWGTYGPWRDEYRALCRGGR